MMARKTVESIASEATKDDLASKGLLTVPRAAERFGLATSVLHRLIRSGQLKAQHDHGITLLRIEDIRDVLPSIKQIRRMG